LLDKLDKHVVQLRREQSEIMANLEQKHKEFRETAMDFRKAVKYAAIGGAMLLGILMFLAFYLTGR